MFFFVVSYAKHLQHDTKVNWAQRAGCHDKRSEVIGVTRQTCTDGQIANAKVFLDTFDAFTASVCILRLAMRCNNRERELLPERTESMLLISFHTNCIFDKGPKAVDVWSCSLTFRRFERMKRVSLPAAMFAKVGCNAISKSQQSQVE